MFGFDEYAENVRSRVSFKYTVGEVGNREVPKHLRQSVVTCSIILLWNDIGNDQKIWRRKYRSKNVVCHQGCNPDATLSTLTAKCRLLGRWSRAGESRPSTVIRSPSDLALLYDTPLVSAVSLTC